MHFWSLPLTGDRESAFVPAEFSEDYQKSLIGHPENDVRVRVRPCPASEAAWGVHLCSVCLAPVPL